MRRVLSALTMLFATLAAPAAASAAECTLVFTPSTAFVGNGEIVAAGTGWQPNDAIFVSIPSDPGGEGEALWHADESGNLDFGGVNATKYVLGTRTWKAFGDVCSATADLTVLAAPGVPQTDAPGQADPSLPVGLTVVLLAGFALGCVASIRRTRSAG